MRCRSISFDHLADHTPKRRGLEEMAGQAYKWAVIGEVGPVAFCEKVCGAAVIPGS